MRSFKTRSKNTRKRIARTETQRTTKKAWREGKPDKTPTKKFSCLRKNYPLVLSRKRND
jgi:hypothetical protein